MVEEKKQPAVKIKAVPKKQYISHVRKLGRRLRAGWKVVAKHDLKFKEDSILIEK